MADVNGSTVLIELDGVTVPCQTDSATFPFERDMIETTCKDSAGSYKTHIPGEKGGTFDATINLDWLAAEGISGLWEKWDSGTLTPFKFGDVSTVGEKHFAGDCYISNVTPEGTQNSKGTASFTATVTGVVTLVTNV